MKFNLFSCMLWTFAKEWTGEYFFPTMEFKIETKKTIYRALKKPSNIKNWKTRMPRENWNARAHPDKLKICSPLFCHRSQCSISAYWLYMTWGLKWLLHSAARLWLTPHIKALLILSLSFLIFEMEKLD